MRVLFTHGTEIGDVVSHDHVGQGEVGRGAVGQVAHDQPVRLASCLVDNQEVSDCVGPAGFQKLLVLVVTAVEALGVGNDQAELWKIENEYFEFVCIAKSFNRSELCLFFYPRTLCELFQPGRRISRGCDHDFGILHPRPSILVVLAVDGGHASVFSSNGLGQLRSRIVPGLGFGQGEGVTTKITVDQTIF